MSPKKTELLSDDPTASDAFGTHKKIADLLHEEIVRSDEGRSIALVGDWGSGKSTVIEILREDLGGDSGTPTHVFIYDAWSHQGDSLRRAFLDDFITSLNGFLTEKQRSNAVDRVWNRTETTTTTREPILRRHAKIMLLSLVLVPLGMKLFPLTSDSGDIPWYWAFPWINFLLLMLIVAPVLFAFLFGAINCWVKEPSIRRFVFGDSYEDRNFSVLSLFVEKTQGEVERREIKSPDDSIGTFREVFSEIVNDVHSRQNDLRIVIVIDNIDRIPAEEAREFWSTMQTFFSDGGGLRRPQRKRYWLIAPFSVEALSFIFGDHASGTATPMKGGLITDNDNPNSDVPTEDAKVRAKAYIDRTFGLAFHVPPPILSNWRKYLLSCLQKAFVEHEKPDLEAVRDIYDYARTGTGFITPRDIKLFVNSLVALYRQRGDEIPLPMMAAYHLHREKIRGTEIPDNLITPQERQAIGVRNWRAMMAALHFGVSPEDGAQLLLRGPIVRALREGSEEDLKNLENRSGFSDILRKVVLDELGTSQAEDGTVLAQFAKTLSVLECSGKPESAHIWRDIGRAFENVKEWPGLRDAPADGVSDILEHTNQAERLVLCKAVAGSLSTLQPFEAEEAQEDLSRFAKNWVITARAIVSTTGFADGFKIDVPLDVNFALEVVKQLAALEIEPADWSAFKLKTPVAKLSNALADDIKAGRMPNEFGGAFRYRPRHT